MSEKSVVEYFVESSGCDATMKEIVRCQDEISSLQAKIARYDLELGKLGLRRDGNHLIVPADSLLGKKILERLKAARQSRVA